MHMVLHSVGLQDTLTRSLQDTRRAQMQCSCVCTCTYRIVRMQLAAGRETRNYKEREETPMCRSESMGQASSSLLCVERYTNRPKAWIEQGLQPA